MATATTFNFREMAGLSDRCADWKHVPKKLEEAEAPKVTRESLRIKRLVQTLQEGEFGGKLRLEFDWDAVERLAEAAEADPHAKEISAHHWNARMATSQAHEIDKGGDAKASHHHHAQAAEKHRNASKALGAAGHDHLARVHDQWAAHHERHAAHHALGMGGIQATAHKPASTTAKSDLPGYEGVHHSIQAHAKTAHQAARVAVNLHSDPNTSHKELAMAHHDASNQHMHTALRMFKAGHHEHALNHFNAAIHHSNLRAQHSQALKTSQRPRQKAGPRAIAGRTHVSF
jgi:hypothetical protein